MKTRFMIAAAALAAAGACGRSKPSDDPAADAAATATAQSDDDTDEAGDGPPKRVALTSSKLAPVIHHLASADTVPTAIVVDLGVPIVDQGLVGSTTDKTVLKITPEVRGAVTYSSVSGVTFTPQVPLAFDTAYEVELLEVDTRDGVLEPPQGARWKHGFKTPPFKILGWSPAKVELPAALPAAASKAVTMDLAFSGPVLAHVVLSALEVLVDGKKPARVGLGPSPSASVLSIRISDPALAIGSKLSFALTRDVMALADARLTAGRGEYVLTSDKAISIKTAGIVEGANGFYLEVVCDDSRGARRATARTYEDGSYYNLSQRCQLSDDALEQAPLRRPPVKKTYITGGRAGFRMFGDFKRGVYKMKIDGGATSVDGGVVLAPFTRSFSVLGAQAAAVVRRERPLPAAQRVEQPRRSSTTTSTAVNLDRPPDPGRRTSCSGSARRTDAADERTSNVILKKTIPLRGAPDAPATTWLDVASLLPATTKGVLEMQARRASARSATSRLLLTNMSLVAKKTSHAGQAVGAAASRCGRSTWTPPRCSTASTSASCARAARPSRAARPRRGAAARCRRRPTAIRTTPSRSR